MIPMIHFFNLVILSQIALLPLAFDGISYYRSPALGTIFFVGRWEGFDWEGLLFSKGLGLFQKNKNSGVCLDVSWCLPRSVLWSCTHPPLFWMSFLVKLTSPGFQSPWRRLRREPSKECIPRYVDMCHKELAVFWRNGDRLISGSVGSRRTLWWMGLRTTCQQQEPIRTIKKKHSEQ